MIGPWFTDGTLVDAILLLVVVEWVGLSVYWRWRGHGIAPCLALATLCAGAFLLLALRAALTGWHPSWMALFLTGALIAHLIDLRLRWIATSADHNTPRRPLRSHSFVYPTSDSQPTAQPCDSNRLR